MWDVLRRSIIFFVLLLGLIFILYSANFGVGSTSIPTIAHAMVIEQSQRVVSACPSPKAPTEGSMLVVVLDRSGSLVTSDPNEYSTSVAKILADLWPGSMAVVLMSGGGDALQYLGPETLSNDNARKHLRDEIEQQRSQLGAYTPLEAALNKAFNLLSANNFPAGSRVILITDGEPSIPGDLKGTQQKQDIENGIIPQFCAQGIPINAFGLSINNTTDPLANPLLEEITDETGGATFEPYQNITDPGSLGKAVINLYAKWRGLTLVPVSPQNGFFPVSIDTYARQAYIVTFHSSDKLLPLLGPDHQEVPEAAFQQYSTDDTHYNFYNLSGKQFSTSGQYLVDASIDPQASVYKLEETRLQVMIIEPTSQTEIYAGQWFTVTAAFYDGNTSNHVRLNPGQGSIEMTCTLLVNGTATSCGEEPLNQEGKPNNDLYSNQITPPQVGKVVIKVIGTVEDVPIAETPDIKLQVQQAPCGLNFGCNWDRYHTQIIAFGLAALLLLLLLSWWVRPRPFGALRQGPRGILVPLGEGRGLARRVLSKSLIHSDELEDSFPAFVGANFDLVFHRKEVDIKAKNGTVPIKVRNGRSYVDVPQDGSEVSLSEGNVINVNGRDVATFTEAV